MKLAAAILTVIALVLAGLWLAYVRAPSPHEVCEHKIAITLAEVGDQHVEAKDSLLDHLRLDCVKQREKLLQLRGKIAYARQAKCILAATTLSESERCG